MPGSPTAPAVQAPAISRLAVLPSVSGTASAPGKSALSRLDGWPMQSPADASQIPSRAPTHGSGPMWFATPSSQWTSPPYSLPVSRRSPLRAQMLTLSTRGDADAEAHPLRYASSKQPTPAIAHNCLKHQKKSAALLVSGKNGCLFRPGDIHFYNLDSTVPLRRHLVAGTSIRADEKRLAVDATERAGKGMTLSGADLFGK